MYLPYNYFLSTFTVNYQAIKGISTILSALFYDFLAWHRDWQALLDYKGPKQTAPLPSMYRKSALVACWPLFIAHLWVQDMWVWLFLMSDRLWKELKLAPTCRPADPWQNGQIERWATGWMRAVWTVSPPTQKSAAVYPHESFILSSDDQKVNFMLLSCCFISLWGGSENGQLVFSQKNIPHCSDFRLAVSYHRPPCWPVRQL